VYDLTGFVATLGRWLERYRLGEEEARFTRHLRRAGYDSTRSDPYAVAGVANIAYMLAEQPGDAERRAAWVESLQSFQDPATGIFVDIEQSHSHFHTTAHCTAALELFDARPAHPMSFLEPLREVDQLRAFLEEQDWSQPWRTSHIPAGLASTVTITETFDHDWLAAWLDWMDAEVDPTTGLWRTGQMLSTREDPGFFSNLGGAFHYHFVYEHLRQPWPYPERVIDSCLRLLYDSAMTFAVHRVGFAEIDLVYCLNRARRQTPHRWDEVTVALTDFTERVLQLLTDPDYLDSEAADDVHVMFGAICTVAELQRALPGTIHTPRPLRLVLDRRPFI